MNEWLSMLILGVVEGVTEFLPISSTGHLILANAWMGIDDEKSHSVEIIIQLGAILAVAWEYRAKIVEMIAKAHHSILARNIVVAFLPAMILGLLFHKSIKAYLFNPLTVALSLAVGGVVILIVEHFLSRKPPEALQEEKKKRITTDHVESMSMKQALIIGFIQVLAMIPGTSRSASTIIGGLCCGLSRQCATEFSFFLALPTLGGACVYEFYKSRALFIQTDHQQLLQLGLGLMTAFIVALLSIRWLLRFVRTHTFKGFAYYRLALAGVIFFLLAH